MSPTARTLKHFRDHGYYAEVVERYIPQARKRVDLAGCIDIIVWGWGSLEWDTLSLAQDVALMEGQTFPVLVGVQTTSASNHAARRTKALAEPRLKAWLESWGRFAIVTWGRKGPRGGRKVWTARVEELALEDFA